MMPVRALTKWLLQQGCQERTATIKEMAREIDEAISEECRARQKVDKLLLLRVVEDLEARRTEMALHVLAYNMKRVMQILGNESGGNHLVLELADVFPRVCEWIDARTLIAHR
jgi:hypothetical protein